jgi:hypothetical protein
LIEQRSSNSERYRQGTEEDLRDALRALEGEPTVVRASDWPGQLPGLDKPGLYSWWVDVRGATDLSEGIGAEVCEGRIYAGQTGATKWPSGKTGRATLGSRIGRNHLRGRIRGSTFRLTLASALWRSLELEIAGPAKLAPVSESRLSSWMADHLGVAVFPFADPDPLGWLEDRVLEVLDPPLNLDRRAPSAVRQRLRALRRGISQGESA